MSKDLNLCTFIGRLGKDVELRFMPDGNAVANLVLAVGDDYKTKEGQKVEQTEWIRCVAYRKSAEILAEYTKKGSQLYISGKMKTKKYTDAAGVEKYATEISINDFQFLGSKGEGQAPQAQPAQQRQTPTTDYKKPPAVAVGSQQPQFNIDEDHFPDVPF